MRDILLSAILFGAIPIALVRPFFAIAVFIWVSVMNPHRLTYGFAFDMPFAQIFALVALASIVMHERSLFSKSLQSYKLVLVYIAWMAISTLLAADPEEAQTKFSEVIKIHLMCLATLTVLANRQRVIWTIYLVVGSIAFYGVKGGWFTLKTGGGGRVWGPPNSMIADNNELAVALVFALPLVYWMVTTTKKHYLKLAGYGSMILMILSILGSQSRGAFLALAAIGLFLVIKGRKNFLAVMAMLVIGSAGLSFMPDSYWSRIDTISNYEQDQSAQGRLYTWKTAIAVANHRPTGAGYNYYGSDVYRRFAPDGDRVHSAHSIYFQALGEQGWIGLLLYLAIIISFWRNCTKIISAANPNTERGRSDALLGRMLQVGLAGFLVGGAFVNIGYWDIWYFLYVASIAFIWHQTEDDRVTVNTEPEDNPTSIATEKIHGVRLGRLGMKN